MNACIIYLLLLAYISKIQQNIGRKLSIFPPRVFKALVEEFPLELCNAGWVRKTRTIGLGREKFDIFAVSTIRQTDGRTDTGRRLVPRLS